MPIRPIVAGNLLLQLDGVSCGSIRSFTGGAATADVIEEPGLEFFSRKHLGPVRYEDITIQTGFSMGKPLLDWIVASLQMTGGARDGAIILADQNFQARSELQFENAVITEIDVPACDASSKEPGYLTIRLAPERTHAQAGAGRVAGRLDRREKLWVSSNFRLQIDGLDCSRVMKVDAFSIKQSITPARLDFPNLAVALPEVSGDTWRRWHEDFVIDGRNDETQEKAGSLVLLSANLQETVLTIGLQNLGIFRLDLDVPAASVEAVSRMRAQLYCERMDFSFG